MAEKPRWDEDLRTLFLGMEPEKEFIRPAPEQEAILRGFQEIGWGEVLDDPPPYLPAEATRRRLRNVVRNLNRHLTTGGIHFYTANHDTAVRWRFVNGQMPKKKRRTRN
jgi:hypothetical protein